MGEQRKAVGRRMFSGAFGVSPIKLAKSWEASLEDQKVKETLPEDVVQIYLERLRWLQHERLIHLMVTLATLGLFIWSLTLTLTQPAISMIWSLALILGGLSLAYLIHYFQLENLVQRWYVLLCEVQKAPVKNKNTD